MPLFSGRIRLNYGPGVEGVAGSVHIAGRFTTAGAATPTVFSTGPFTVARTAVGTYTVTFTEIFNEVIAVQISLGGVTGTLQRAVEIVAATSPGASPKTPAQITIETQTPTGTAADLTAPVVNFSIYFRRGRLTK